MEEIRELARETADPENTVFEIALALCKAVEVYAICYQTSSAVEVRASNEDRTPD